MPSSDKAPRVVTQLIQQGLAAWRCPTLRLALREVTQTCPQSETRFPLLEDTVWVCMEGRGSSQPRTAQRCTPQMRRKSQAYGGSQGPQLGRQL